MIRIAIRMLMGDATKYLGLVFGVLFSCLLMTVLMGMFGGMLSRTYALVDDTSHPDIWIMDPAVEYVDETAPLPDTAVRRVSGVTGVEWAVPMYTGNLRTRLDDGRFRNVQVIGVDDATLIGLPPRLINVSPEALRSPDAVFVDEVSARTTLRRHDRPLRAGDVMLINDRRTIVAGLCEVSPRFMPKPTIYTTYSRATAIAPPERRLLSFVLAKAASGERPDEVARRISDATGYRARSSLQIRSDTFLYYVRNTDVLSHVGLMVVLGVVVGFSIVALLLTMFTRENFKHYAVLKAMGTSNVSVLLMLVTQAVTCSSMGFGGGLGLACLLGFVGDDYGIPFRITWHAPAISGACVLLICVVAIAINTRPLLRLSPAEVFRS